MKTLFYSQKFRKVNFQSWEMEQFGSMHAGTYCSCNKLQIAYLLAEDGGRQSVDLRRTTQELLTVHRCRGRCFFAELINNAAVSWRILAPTSWEVFLTLSS